MDSWGTHVPALAAAIKHTSGDILELGCGDYSTPLIHALADGRRVLSVEHNDEWLRRYTGLLSPHHSVMHVPDWDEFIASRFVSECPWGLIVVDHGPGDRRADDLRRLVSFGSVFVIHDTDASCYGWGDVMKLFGWVYTYTRWETWTTVAGHGDRPAWPDLLVPGAWGLSQPWR